MLTHYSRPSETSRQNALESFTWRLLMLGTLVFLAACAAGSPQSSEDKDAATPDASLEDTPGDSEQDVDTGDALFDDDEADTQPVQVTMPESRDSSPCPDYTTRNDTYQCSEGSSEVCGVDADCDRGLCQGLFIDGWHSCACFPIGCRSDAECAADEACYCADAFPVFNGAMCGIGPGNCESRCIPAGCRSDEDCGDEGICRSVRDSCGDTIAFACWTAGEAQCGTDNDCSRNSAWGLCTLVDGTWQCGERSMCDS